MISILYQILFYFFKCILIRWDIRLLLITCILFFPCTNVFYNIFLQNGETPLWIASSTGHDHVVELLLQVGADKDIPNNVRMYSIYRYASPFTAIV